MIQLIAVRDIGACIWCAPTKAGEAVWIRDEKAARHLIEHGFCKLPEVKTAEVAEVLEAPAPRKHSGEAILGRSIVSPSSKGRGSGVLSSALVGGLVSPQRL